MSNNTPSSVRKVRRLGRFVALFSALLLFGSLASQASAAAPDFLFQTPADVKPGPAAGQLGNPRDIVADPDTGHLYVTELGNSRISEFTPWGAFVKAWGWDVSPEGAPGDTLTDEFEVCTTVCQAGIEGNGAGQINSPRGLTLDANGDLYIYEGPLDGSSKRVQKFSPSGLFLLMFGGGVNQGPSNPGSLCTAQHITEGDTCGAGISGTADGQFASASVDNYLAYNPVTDTIFVGDADRIQEFDTDGNFVSKIDFEGSLSAFDGKAVNALAADPVNGDLYLSFPSAGTFFLKLDPGVHRLDPASGEVLDVLPIDNPGGSIAADIDGNVYAIRGKINNEGPEVIGFDPLGNPLAGMEAGDGFAALPKKPGFEAFLFGLATNVLGPGSEEPGNLFVTYFSSGSVSSVKAYGPPPVAFEDPPVRPPEILDQYAVSVDTDGATVKAEMVPHFWADTTYRVQYGTGKCSEGGCSEEHPLAPGSKLTSKVTNAPVTAPGVFLGALEPATTYHYRFVARSGGSEGEDIIGVGGKLGEPGAEGSFRTFPLPTPPAACTDNAQFRTGPSAKLPDCRAYEMVSPLDKNNGDVLPTGTLNARSTGLHQSSPTGQRFTYSSSRAFGDAVSTPYASQYLAERDPGSGWESEAISPPASRIVLTAAGLAEKQFWAFSEDLCQSWLRTSFDPPLVAGSVPGFANLYRRQNCGDEKGELGLLTPNPPPHVTPDFYVNLEFQGASQDGAHAIYAAPDNLSPEAPVNEDKRHQLYQHSEGEELRFVCVLPNGNPTQKGCGGGTTVSNDGRESSLQGAISTDASRVFWTESETGAGPGRIYVRFRDEPSSRRVSQSVSGAAARYWGASKLGERAIFSIEDGVSSLNGNLYSFDVDADQETLIAGAIKGVLGISADARRVYFVSTQALPGSGQNSEADEAQAGKPNLYLWEEEGDAHSFIGTLADGLVDSALVARPSPLYRTVRVTPDGLHATFLATASLTGYDNKDAITGEAATEVFLYDAEEDQIRCISCNPSGARPMGQKVMQGVGGLQFFQAAAKIPGSERSLYPSRLLSDDGTRLFFESFEALVPRDTNGVSDVYQWELEDEGECDEGDSTFTEETGGCVELISSGESPRGSVFLDASPDGKDVFFATLSSLLVQDYGLVDVYDARDGGGFPPPPSPPAECEGEACQGPLAAPDDPTPASSAFEGSGNVAETPRPTKKCAKGRRAVRKAGRTRCVRRPQRAKRQKRAKRANDNRRAAR